MRMICLHGLFVLSLVACTSSVEIPDAISAYDETIPVSIDYNQHIKPILSDRCYKCHGPDKNKVEAGLQLINAESASATLESGMRAIVPGEIGQSEMIRRIISADSDDMMPPPESHLTLTDEERALIIRWVEQGAKFKEHWSLNKIQKPDVPSVGKSWLSRLGITSDDETKWVTNEIDHFVLNKLSEKKLQPSPPANPETILRRVYMDLTGLPPSPEEVQEYLNDKSANAYEKVIDKLLASPHYGEHMATGWLDLARYADSHGYQDDGMRNVYPYRDWVIHAFNTNLSFDKFITWQLAGDLIPGANKESIMATSFNRQHPQSQEGGIVAQEYLTEYVADRTNTFGKAFLGLTMECARCHDHKYDPISARDYFSLYAFFNQNKEHGGVPYSGEASPTILVPEKDVEEKLNYIREKISMASEKLDPAKVDYKQGFEKFASSVSPGQRDSDILKKGLLVHIDFEKEIGNKYINNAGQEIYCEPAGDYDRKPVFIKGKSGNGIQFRGDCGIQLVSKADTKAKTTPDRYYKGLNFERNQSFSISIWYNILDGKTNGPLLTKNNGEFEGYRGYDFVLNPDHTLTFHMMYVYPANGIELQTTEKIPVNEWTHISMTYDGSATAKGVRIFINGKIATVKVITDNLTKSILHAEKKSNWSFMPLQIGKNFLTTMDKIEADELRIYNRKLSQLEIEALYTNSPTVSLEASKEKLYEYYLMNYDREYELRQTEITALRLEETQLVTDIPELMVMWELPPDQQRKTYILDRGVYDSPGEEVVAAIPARLGKLPEGYPGNRLGLAKWLLAEENPLFARVIVNRLWARFFGNGIVRTQEDFGNQGSMPSHPELLDWLATSFREGQWDSKAFIRRIVLSSTYRQSSVATAEQIEYDPDNQWLSRGPAYRYSAEQVRDQVLASSGLLVKKIGGPSVYPYQPDGIWEALATRNAVTYKQNHGDSLYRRSLYTIWKRSSPPPMMLNFDAPDRSTCAVRRQRTATPLQSLVTMNDPQFIEAARVLAERVIQGKKTDEERIEYVFMSALSRLPRDEEKSILKELLTLQREHYSRLPEEAKKLQHVGEYPVSKGLAPEEVAAYTVVANTVFNTDEALNKR